MEHYSHGHWFPKRKTRRAKGLLNAKYLLNFNKIPNSLFDISSVQKYIRGYKKCGAHPSIEMRGKDIYVSIISTSAATFLGNGINSTRAPDCRFLKIHKTSHCLLQSHW